jgi:hypothetical protein
MSVPEALVLADGLIAVGRNQVIEALIVLASEVRQLNRRCDNTHQSLMLAEAEIAELRKVLEGRRK